MNFPSPPNKHLISIRALAPRNTLHRTLSSALQTASAYRCLQQNRALPTNPVRAARHGTPSSPIALETMDAETTPQQQQYPNLNPYESSNGTSSSVEQTKNTVVSSKVRAKHTNTFASSSSSGSVISVPGQQTGKQQAGKRAGSKQQQQQQQHTSGQHVTSRTTAGVNE